MIRIKYEGIPKESPAYKGVDHYAEGSFSELDINVNRTTLATLLRFTNELTRELATISFAQAEAPQAVAVTPVSPDSVIFRMKFGLSAIRLSLVKEHKHFLQMSLEKADLALDLNGDNSLALALSLASLSVRDFYNTPWSYILSTGVSVYQDV
jgi:hypothetical protein